MVFLLLVFAVFRLTMLLVSEDGPFDALAWLRTHLPGKFLNDLFGCFWCMSIWVAGLLSPLVAWYTGDWYLLPVIWLGSSGAACTVSDMLEAMEPQQVFVEVPMQDVGVIEDE